MNVIQLIRTLVALSALLLIAAVAAHPIFCDRFETDSCTQLPELSVELTSLETFDSGQLIIRLGKAAITDGQEVFLVSSAPDILGVPSVVQFSESEDEQIIPVTTGMLHGEVTIEATATDYLPAARQFLVQARELQILTGSIVEIGHSVEGFVELARAATEGGAELEIISTDPGVVSVFPTTITIPEGQTRTGITLSAENAGTVDIVVSSPGYAQSALQVATVPSIINIGFPEPMIPGQQRSLPVILAAPAPAGGLTIAFETSNPEIATVEALVTIPAGQRLPQANPQIGSVAKGEAVITARAEGFAPIQRPVLVRDYSLQLSPEFEALSPGWADSVKVTLSDAAPPEGLSIAFASSNDAVFTTPSSVTVPPGQTTAVLELEGIAQGQAQLIAGGDDIQATMLSVVVGELPDISVSSPRVGKNLQDRYSVGLSRSLSEPGDLTLTVEDSSIALISVDKEQIGSPSVTFGARSSGRFFIQGIETGETFLNASIEGFSDQRVKLTVTNSGFFFEDEDIVESPRDWSDDFDLNIQAARLTTEGKFKELQSVRAGLTIDIPLFNSNPSVGSLSDNLVTFRGAGDAEEAVVFFPQGYGTSTVSFAQPPGFTAPVGLKSLIDISIVKPLHVEDITVGQHLQRPNRGSFFSRVSPSDITLMVTDPSIAVLSAERSVPGSEMIELFFDPLQSWNRSFYVQGIGLGSTTMIVSAPGFDDVESTITVTESGFRFANFDNASNPISLTPDSLPFALAIYSSYFDGMSESPVNSELRPGLDIEIALSNSSPMVGSLIDNPIALEAGFENRALFQASSVGSTTVSLIQPPGFVELDVAETSAQFDVVQAEVLIEDFSVGRDLQGKHHLRLRSMIDPQLADVLISVADPSLARLSIDALSPGTETIELVEVSSSASGFYVQGLQQGETELIVTAPGMEERRAALTVTDSGFVISSPESIQTEINAWREEFKVRASRLSGDGTPLGSQTLRPGLSLAVFVSVADSKVGEITSDPLIFRGGINLERTGFFKPTAMGTTTISLNQPAGFTSSPVGAASIDVQVGAASFTFDIHEVGENLQAAHTIQLTQRPLVPIDLTLSIDDPLLALLSTERSTLGSPFILIENTLNSESQAFYIQGLAQGATSLTVSAPGYQDAQAPVSILPSKFVFCCTSQVSTTTIARPHQLSIESRMQRGDSWSRRAEVRAGLTVEVPINNSHPTVGSIEPDTVVFEAGGGAEVDLEFQPISSGTTVLSFDQPPGFLTESSQTQSVQFDVSRSCFSEVEFGELLIGKDLQQDFRLSLERLPQQPIDIEVSVANPSIARVTNLQTEEGVSSITLFSVQNFWTDWFYFEGISKGSTSFEVSAPGCDSVQGIVTVIDTGMFISRPTRIETTRFAEPSAVDITLSAIDSDGNRRAWQGLRAGLSVEVPVAVQNQVVGQMTDTSVIFEGGQGHTVSIGFVPASTGQTLISIDRPAGFDLPAQSRDSIPVDVRPDRIQISGTEVGKDLQKDHSFRLPEAPPTAVDVFLRIDRPDIALLSTDRLLAGSNAIEIENVATNDAVSFYLQGLNEGYATLTVAAPGFFPRSATIFVTPSSFSIARFLDIETTTMSEPIDVDILVSEIGWNGAFSPQSELRAGLSLEVPLIFTNPSVGDLLPDPVIFEGGTGSRLTTQFVPMNPGTSEIQLIQPVGFISPLERPESLGVSVRNPSISFLGDLAVGVGLQTERSARLEGIPSEPVDLTLSVSDPNVAQISADQHSPGAQSIVLEDYDGSQYGSRFWIQGISKDTTMLTASAPGFDPVEVPLEVTGSGFFINRSSPSFINTLEPSSVRVESAKLDQFDLFEKLQTVRAGLALEVPILSSRPEVGQVSNSPLIFDSASSASQSTTFEPQAVGQTRVSVIQPPQFTAPVNRNESVLFNVGLPDIELEAFAVGEDLQLQHEVRLSEWPPEAVDVTLSIADPSIALVSGTQDQPGSASIFFGNVSGSTTRFYVQGIEQGTTTLTVAAPGFAPAQATIEVTASGFYIASPTLIDTTPISRPTPISVRPFQLIEADPPWNDPQIRAGLTVAVPIFVKDPAVGQLVASQVVFEGGVGVARTVDFFPAGLGSTQISIVQPQGFESLPEDRQFIDVTVDLAEFQIPEMGAGVNLQSNELLRLSTTPGQPVDVLLTIEDPSIAVISKNRDEVGTASVLFENWQTSWGQTLYLQGLVRGTTMLTASADGVETIQVPVTVSDSGFYIDSPSSIITSVNSYPRSIQVRAGQLSPDGSVISSQNVRAGLTLEVPIVTDHPQVGFMTVSPILFSSSGLVTPVTRFDPVSPGETTIRLIQPTGSIVPLLERVAIPVEVRQ